MTSERAMPKRPIRRRKYQNSSVEHYFGRFREDEKLRGKTGDNITHGRSYEVEKISNPESVESTFESPGRLSDQLAFCRRLTEDRERQQGFVYIIQAGDFVKIGVAKDVERRIRLLQCGCPFKIELLAAMPCDDPYGIESKLHAALHRYRTQGEWFIAIHNEIDAAVLSVFEPVRRV